MMRSGIESRFKALAVSAAIFFAATSHPLRAQQQAPQQALPDVQRLGPQVGTRVPDFSLTDQRGAVRTLQSLMGPKGLLLFFFRSADWCPYCKTQLVELQSRLPELSKQGLGVAAVSYDAVPVLADFTRRRGITFPLLSDVGSATIRKYDILNTTILPSNAQSYGIPFPGTFVLDRNGVVTSRFFEQAYQERATVGSMLARLGNNIEVPATTVRSPQIEVTSYTTDTVVAPGTHFSVVLDVKPAAGVHVYAPGVVGYKPIALTMQAAPGLLLRDAQYPRAETYTFKPLNERVQVYQRPFRIVQDVTIDPSPQAATAVKDGTTLTIQATLNYQACNDTVCFSPQAVPLSWTVNLRQLDRERVKP